MAYCPSAVVLHDHRTTLRGFVRQQFNFGRGACRYRALRRQRTRESSPIGRTGSGRLHSLLREPLRKLPLWLANGAEMAKLFFMAPIRSEQFQPAVR